MTIVTQSAHPSDARAWDGPLAELGGLVDGRVLLADAPDYRAMSMPWNVAAASTPVAVVEVATATDVATAVRFAGVHGLEVAVQATGHGAIPWTRPTLLVQTSRLDELEIRSDGSARVGAGVRWQRVLDAGAPLGLGGLAGSSPNVGVVGYLTGGGMGPVARTFGFGSDHVSAFDVVTGDGELRRATAQENPALFWALRGGKGALGIVTAVEFELMPLTEIYGGALYFDRADAATVARAWREWSQTLPEQATTSLAFLRLPPLPSVPPPLAGRLTVAVRFAWVGDHEEGRRAFDTMRHLAPVVLGDVAKMPYGALGAIHADPVDPMPVHEEALLLRELPAEGLEALLDHIGPDSDSPQFIAELRLMGGAIARSPRWASAVSHRDAAANLHLIGLGVPPVVEATVAHGRRVLEAMAPWSNGTSLANFAPSSDPVAVAGKYDAPTLARLGTLAATYDPNCVIAAANGVRAACGREQ